MLLCNVPRPFATHDIASYEYIANIIIIIIIMVINE